MLGNIMDTHTHTDIYIYIYISIKPRKLNSRSYPDPVNNPNLFTSNQRYDTAHVGCYSFINYCPLSSHHKDTEWKTIPTPTTASAFFPRHC
jgi:hypothetical protein